MSRTILIECSPRRPADGAVVPVRLAWKPLVHAASLGVQWHTAISGVPALESSLGFDGRTFAAAPTPQVGELMFALTQATRFAGALVWDNAAITMRHAEWPAGGGAIPDADFAIIWRGQAAAIASSKGESRVQLLDNGQSLRVPALAAKFGTTGDALLDGADALKDRPADSRVPRAWGKVLCIPGQLVDRANQIWLFAGNPATAVASFSDGGAYFTLGAARASLAALRANVPAAGTVDYCLNAAGTFLARPWTPPTYIFSCEATFGSTKAADIASAIVTGRTAITFTAGTVAAFNALMTADHGLYLDDDTSVAAALDRLFSGVGAWWRPSSAGTITLGRWGWTAPARTIAAHRRHAPDRLRIIAPTRRRSLGFAHNDKIHTEADIARILLAGDLAYADGTSIEALKPAAAGADVTAANTSANSAALGGVAATSVAASIGAASVTATWTGLSGIGKAADYATQNAAGDFLNDNGSFDLPVNVNGSIPGWAASTYPGTFALFSYPAVSTRGTMLGHITGQQVISSNSFQLTPGEANWSRCRFIVQSGSSGGAAYVQAFMRCFDSSGGYITDIYLDNAAYAAGFAYTRGIVAFNIPAGAVFGQLLFAVDLPYAIGTAGSMVFIDYFDTSNTQFGATLGANRRNMGMMFGGGVQLVYSVEPLSESNVSGVGTITIAAHTVTDDLGTISYSGGSISGLTPGTRYAVYDDDPTFAGGTRTYAATNYFPALAAAGRRLVGYITIRTNPADPPQTGGGGGTGGGGRGGGGGAAIP